MLSLYTKTPQGFFCTIPKKEVLPSRYNFSPTFDGFVGLLEISTVSITIATPYSRNLNLLLPRYLHKTATVYGPLYLGSSFNMLLVSLTLLWLVNAMKKLLA